MKPETVMDTSTNRNLATRKQTKKLTDEGFSHLENLVRKGDVAAFKVCCEAVEPLSSHLRSELLIIAIKNNKEAMINELLFFHEGSIEYIHLLSALNCNLIDFFLLFLSHKKIHLNPNNASYLLTHNLVKNSPYICKTLISIFHAKASMENFFSAIESKNFLLLYALLPDDAARNFYEKLMGGDLFDLTDFLAKNKDDLSTTILEAFLLLCANQKKFDLADIIYSEALATKPEYSPSFKQPWHISSLPTLTNRSLPPSKKHTIMTALHTINQLLSNGNRCIPLLQQLDNQIAKYQNYLNMDYASIKPEQFVSRNGMKWPKPPDNIEASKSYSLLRMLLQEIFKEFGIDCTEKMLNFCGFVPGDTADQVILNNQLFKEHHLVGNALFHGIFSHYLQIYIILRALQTGIIKTKESEIEPEISLQDLLHAFITTKERNGISYWNIVLDRVSEEGPNPMDFRYTENLNQVLFWMDSLPHLRGYFVNDWYRKVNQYLTTANNQNEKKLSFEVMIALSAIANNYFMSFNPFHEDSMKHYYATRSYAHFDEQVNVSTKLWETRYQFWCSPFNSSKASEAIDLFGNPHTVNSNGMILP